jgi:hypothetical protein
MIKTQGVKGTYYGLPKKTTRTFVLGSDKQGGLIPAYPFVMPSLL